jgi:hypothetical protein
MEGRSGRRAEKTRDFEQEVTQPEAKAYHDLAKPSADRRRPLLNHAIYENRRISFLVYHLELRALLSQSGAFRLLATSIR